jgi:competence protein ComEC
MKIYITKCIGKDDMKRPVCLFSLWLILGVWLGSTVNLLWFILISISITVLSAIIFTKVFKAPLFIIMGVLLFYFAGAFEFMCIDRINTEKFLQFSGEQVRVKGFICSEPDVREHKIIYQVRVSEIHWSKGQMNTGGNILLTTLRNSETRIYEYGSSIEAGGQLTIPKGRRAPGGFDYRRFLAKSGVSATLFAKNEDIVIGRDKGGNALVKIGLGIRSRIVDVIERSLPKEQAALLCGMLVGYTAGMSEEAVNAFSDAGLSHLTAVSGANVAFIVFPIFFLLKRLKVGLRTANSIIIGVLVLFVFVTGFSPSVVRAVIMAIVLLLGQILRRETDVITSISFAAILLILYNPYMLFDIGFQLSFAATLSLVLFYKNLKPLFNFRFVPNFISDVLAATLAAQIGTFLISAYNFNKISIISVVSNLLVVPLVEVVTVIGAVMAIIGQISIVLSQALGFLNCTFLWFILYVTKLSSSIPFAVIKVVTPSVFLIILFYTAALYFLWLKPTYKIKLKIRYYAAVSGIILALAVLTVIIPKNLEVVFLDVGQGDSIFIRTAGGKTVLIDGGGFSSRTNTENNMGDYVVIPFLLDYGVSKLDLVIASHAHDDHIQGLMSVLRDFEVEHFVMPYIKDTKDFKKLLEIGTENKIPSRMCRNGEVIRLDSDTFFNVLYPVEGYEADRSPVNNSSLILKLCYKDISVLFTGDIEYDIENMFLEKNPESKADVLKVAHHGSITSTTESFLKAVNPKAAVISVGKNNFGHPSEYVLERLMKNNVHTFRTDIDGTVIMSSDGKKLKFKKTVGQ